AHVLGEKDRPDGPVGGPQPDRVDALVQQYDQWNGGDGTSHNGEVQAPRSPPSERRSLHRAQWSAFASQTAASRSGFSSRDGCDTVAPDQGFVTEAASCHT